MRRPLLALLGTLCLTLGVTLVPAPATAGGPTSVLVGNGQSVSALYYTDDAYTRLNDLVDTAEFPVVEPRDAREVARQGRFEYLLTWLIHDRMVWRNDQVLTHDGDTYLVTSYPALAPGDDETSRTVRVTDPALLGQLDAVFSGKPATSSAPTPARDDVSPAAASVAGEPHAEPAEPGSPARWLLLGAGVGLLAGLLGGGLLAARLSRARREESDSTPAGARSTEAETLLLP